jgi:hypothetical protein
MEEFMNATTQGNKVILEFDLGDYNKKLIDMLLTMEIANQSKATEDDIRELANDTKKGWWQKNKDRLLNENNR